MLVWTVGRRTFPAWVGVAASIKLVPLAFVLVWAGRRSWLPAVVAVGLTGALFAPMLLFDLSNYVTDPGTGLLSLYAVWPVLWIAVALSLTVLTIWLAIHGSPYAWIAAAVLMYLGPPRVVTSYLAFLVPGYLLAIRQTGEAGRTRWAGQP